MLLAVAQRLMSGGSLAIRKRTASAARFALIALSALCLPAGEAAAQQPEIWFSPTDNVTQRGRDFDQLFQNPPAWANSANRVSVFSVPVRYLLTAPAPVVKSQLAWIQSHNMKLAVQVPALPVNKHVCGDGIEGMTWPGEAAHSAKALQALGANVDYFALDLPMTSGHMSRGRKACRLSIQETALRLASAVKELRAVYPAVRIVDLEVPTGIPLAEWTTTLPAWLDAYRQASGENFYGLTMDAWWKFDWRRPAQATARILSSRRIRTGMYLDAVEGSNVAAANWTKAARRNACDLRATQIPVDYVVIANWMDMRVNNLPEGDPSSLTGVLNWFAQGGACS